MQSICDKIHGFLAKKMPTCEQIDIFERFSVTTEDYLVAAVRALRMIDFTVSEGLAPVLSHLSAIARSMS